jgi:hypothetical protein
MKPEKGREVRLRCQGLAARLGCTVTVDRVRDTGSPQWIYRVYGPPYVYRHRRDLFSEHQRTVWSWKDTEPLLEAYMVDLFFAARLTCPEVTDLIVTYCGSGEGRALLLDWVRGDQDSGAVLADWLADQGRPYASDHVRTVAGRGQVPILPPY